MVSETMMVSITMRITLVVGKSTKDRNREETQLFRSGRIDPRASQASATDPRSIQHLFWNLHRWPVHGIHRILFADPGAALIIAVIRETLSDERPERLLELSGRKIQFSAARLLYAVTLAVNTL
ncbi:hypothetical protein RRG08_045423 [Elysia crispata]|uniref:Uncharacterized protein n=1 Tax=Elysia crispata TaxID=231223 RepID=A0AAE1E776_9GAST|nr:hypothetical protein RRG08_045423 [Elysia crispata]